ncbi:AraC family transcriptional regulator [Haloferula sargassicola]|uniref:HTH-type transcriptional activator RhaR n=1 Tax=Haloferula sargassicola TaxID=490096 RepID=A0ABP9ULJ4_9BACT
MSATQVPLRRSHVVRCDDRDQREWLRSQPVCGLLKQHHIAHVEIIEAGRPFQMMRRDQSGTFMFACFGGEGLVLADGKWQPVRSGEACLLPPFITNGIKATGSTPWQLCGVRYLESRETVPIVAQRSPVIGAYEPEPLRLAIQGLHAESSKGSPAQMHLWTELIHSYVLRFAEGYQTDPRLWKLWEQVGATLGQPWTLDELATCACLSKEQLRKLCHRELGRTPMQQVAFLRMQRARHLLSTTRDKIESISRQVGYANPFTFSNTFQKWIGWRPSQIRRAGQAGDI